MPVPVTILPIDILGLAADILIVALELTVPFNVEFEDLTIRLPYTYSQMRSLQKQGAQLGFVNGDLLIYKNSFWLMRSTSQCCYIMYRSGTNHLGLTNDYLHKSLQP
jgi:hypothetical protein